MTSSSIIGLNVARDGWYKWANRAKPSLPFTEKMKKYY
jgi:hypothetical protein